MSIFTAYKTFPDLMAKFIKSQNRVGTETAQAIFYNAHDSMMRSRSKDKSLRMAYYVFSNGEAEELTNLANLKLNQVGAIDPFAEAMFLLQSSHYEVNTYFNLFFFPRSGGYSQDQYVQAFKSTAEFLGYPTATTELVPFLDSLSVTDYANFYAGVVHVLKTFSPSVYQQGLQRFRDLQNKILVNIDNFIDHGSEMERLLANRAAIVNALTQDKSGLVFQEEYLKNLDLSLFTRLILAKISLVIPSHERLNIQKVPTVWRHNARVLLQDKAGEVMPFPLLPKPDSSLFDKAALFAGAVIAIAVVAPYLLSSFPGQLKAVATSVSNLGKAAFATAGEMATVATGAAANEVKSELENAVNERVQAEFVEEAEKDLAAAEYYGTMANDSTRTTESKKSNTSVLPWLFVGAAILKGAG